MSVRLQILVPETLDALIRKAAQRAMVSKGEWVRRAVESVLRRESGELRGGAVDRLAALEAPTADIDEMIAETEAGRRMGAPPPPKNARRRSN